MYVKVTGRTLLPVTQWIAETMTQLLSLCQFGSVPETQSKYTQINEQ